MSKYDKGLKRIEEILGNDGLNLIDNLNMISPDFANYIIEYDYGDLYMRNIISDKSRELAVVSNLIGQGNTGLPLKAHIKGMLNVGWTKTEVVDLITFVSAYSGFPNSVEAMKIAQDVFYDYDTALIGVLQDSN